MPDDRPFRGKNLIGKRYGRLLVVGLSGFKRFKNRPNARFAIWKCKCDCGNKVDVVITALCSGNTKSCGCLHAEEFLKVVFKHGHKPRNGKIHPLYYRWYGMIQRCIHPNNRAYKWYGARGIKVCRRWLYFQNFLNDMESSFRKGLTLDRKNVNGNYTPKNCRWATWSDQRKNTRHAKPQPKS